MALAPVINDRNEYFDHAIVIFVNDIALCAEDILESLYQHRYQHASMTSAFD